MQRKCDVVQNMIASRQHVIVPETKDAKAQCFQISRALLVGSGIHVLASVYLDDESLLHRCEIHDEASEPVLAAEFGAEKTAVPQHRPQRAFGFRLIASERMFPCM